MVFKNDYKFLKVIYLFKYILGFLILFVWWSRNLGILIIIYNRQYFGNVQECDLQDYINKKKMEEKKLVFGIIILGKSKDNIKVI